MLWGYDMFCLMSCTGKIRVLILLGQNIRYFIWAKRGTARHAVMVHSGRHITLLFNNFIECRATK